MPARITQDWETEGLTADSSGQKTGRFFNITGVTSEFEAWAALRDFVPAYFLGLPRAELSVKETGPGIFRGTVRWASTGAGGGTGGTETPVGETPPTFEPAPASPTEPLAGGYEFSFNSEMVRRTQSRRTKYRRQVGNALNAIGTAPNYRGAVGVRSTGTGVIVEGYERPEVASTWSRTVVIPQMTTAFKNTIRDTVGRVNDATFYNSQAGEVLLHSANARHIEGFQYSITYTFHEKKNRTNIVVYPDPSDPDRDLDPIEWNPNLPLALVLPEVLGWEHVWLVYDPEVVDDNLIGRPIAAYVEEVIEAADFSVLGIGV